MLVVLTSQNTWNGKLGRGCADGIRSRPPYASRKPGHVFTDLVEGPD